MRTARRRENVALLDPLAGTGAAPLLRRRNETAPRTVAPARITNDNRKWEEAHCAECWSMREPLGLCTADKW